MATSTKSADKPVKTKPAAAVKQPPAPKSAAAKPAAVKPGAAAKKTAAVSSTVKKAPAQKKSAAAGAKPAKTPAAAKTGNPASKTLRALAPDQRRYYVEVAAYYIAEQRGFHGGSQLDDWIAAEAEIDRLLHAGILNP